MVPKVVRPGKNPSFFENIDYFRKYIKIKNIQIYRNYLPALPSVYLVRDVRTSASRLVPKVVRPGKYTRFFETIDHFAKIDKNQKYTNLSKLSPCSAVGVLGQGREDVGQQVGPEGGTAG